MQSIHEVKGCLSQHGIGSSKPGTLSKTFHEIVLIIKIQPGRGCLPGPVGSTLGTHGGWNCLNHNRLCLMLEPMFVSSKHASSNILFSHILFLQQEIPKRKISPKTLVVSTIFAKTIFLYVVPQRNIPNETTFLHCVLQHVVFSVILRNIVSPEEIVSLKNIFVSKNIFSNILQSLCSSTNKS